jgi:parallel beta-helix repeat protein
MRRLLSLTAVGVCVLASYPACSSPAAPQLRLTVPETVHGWATASVETSIPTRAIAAVTLLVDGRAVGSDTTPPYSVLVDGASLAPGAHRASVELVRRDGTRTRSGASTLVVAHGSGREVVASPHSGFDRALHLLARGNVTVRLRPGRYPVSTLSLGPGARLVGSGPSTVLAAPAGPYWAVVVVRGSDTLLSRLTVDGAGEGGGLGHAIVVQSGVRRFVARDLVIERVRNVGVYAWGSLSDISIQDARITSSGAAEAGVIAALASGDDLSVIRSRIAGFENWGINFVQTPHDNRATGLRALALDNVVTDIDAREDTHGTTKGGIWSGGAGAAIIGNVVRRTGWDGIETVGSSHGVSIVGNRVSNTPVGIYLEHSTTRSLIARNVIEDTRNGINVEWEYAGVGSGQNVFRGNRVLRASAVGLFIDVGADDNRVVANRLDAGVAGIVLQGSSQNHVAGNVVCRASTAVEQRVGLWENARAARPVANRLERNQLAPTCKQ